MLDQLICWVHSVFGQHQHGSAAQGVVREQGIQLLGGFGEPIGIVGIDDKHEALRALVVMAPQSANPVLAADVPHDKGNVLVLDGFHVESNGGDRRDKFTELKRSRAKRVRDSVEASRDEQASQKTCPTIMGLRTSLSRTLSL